MTSALSLPTRPLVKVQRHSLAIGGIFLGVMGLTLVAATLKRPDYAATGRLKFMRNTPTASVTEAGRQVGQLEALVDQTSPLDTETEVIQSAPLVQPVIQALALTDDKGKPLTTQDFLKNLKVSPVRSSDVLAVTYVSKHPEQAAAVVNQLLEQYLAQSIASRRDQARDARNFAEQQLPTSEARVAAAEQALTAFQQRSDTTASSQNPEAILTRASALKQQISDAQSELADIAGQLRTLRAQFSAIAADPTVAQAMLSQSAAVQTALSELQALELELALLKARYQDSSPAVQELEDKVVALRQVATQRRAEAMDAPTAGAVLPGTSDPLYQSLAREIVLLESRQSGLKQKLASLMQLEAEAQQKLLQLPQLQEEQRTLDRTLEIAQATYANLLQKVSELRIAEAQNVGNAEILVSAEVPQKPVSGKTPLYAAGMLLSLMLSGLWIYTAEQHASKQHPRYSNHRQVSHP